MSFELPQKLIELGPVVEVFGEFAVLARKDVLKRVSKAKSG